jgi:phosphoribosylglycinamide synthetase, ATP-grasp (A) domain
MHILIVGKAFSGMKNYLSGHGHTYTVLQDEKATKFPDRRLRNRVVCNFLSPQKIITTAEKINSKRRVDGVIATYEHYITSASLLARHFNLPGLTEKAAQACTDKELMRQMFAKSPKKISPDFSVVSSWEELLEFADAHSFPLILKPANLAKSLLVTKSTTQDELIRNYQYTLNLLDTTYQKYAPNSTPKLIVEEFLEGPIFSVDAFVDNTGEPYVLENVVDYQTGYDIGFNDNFHYSRLLPSRLSKSDVAAIRQTAAIGCRALGMTSSPAHIEIILTRDGPRIVEIGARNGGYRERMHRLANDIDITGNALALSLNAPLDITPKKNDYVGVFELFPQLPGSFVGIAEEGRLQKLPSFNYLGIKAKAGQYVGRAASGYKMCAVVILANKDKASFDRDVAIFNNHVHVLTRT